MIFVFVLGGVIYTLDSILDSRVPSYSYFSEQESDIIQDAITRNCDYDLVNVKRAIDHLPELSASVEPCSIERFLSLQKDIVGPQFISKIEELLEGADVNEDSFLIKRIIN